MSHCDLRTNTGRPEPFSLVLRIGGRVLVPQSHGPLVPRHQPVVPLRVLTREIILVAHKKHRWKMLQPMPTRGATTWIGGVYEDKQRRKLVIAILLLLAAITAVLVRDYESSLGNNQAVIDSASEPVYAPATAGPAPVVPVAIAQVPVATKPSAKTSSSHTHSNARLASNSVKHQVVKSSATWASATVAAQRTSDQALAHPPVPSYPLLTEASAVKGSVLLQALIGADGAVQEMRVISGPTILVSAARQAVQQWRFKPYLVNGKPVETYARVTVNFSIDVSNTEARIHLNSVTSTGAL